MKKIRLNSRGFEYVYSSLENGGTLGHCLLEKLLITPDTEVEVLTDGDVPEGHDLSAGRYFVGGRQLLQSRISEHLSSEKSNLCLFYAIDPKRGDPFLDIDGSKCVFNFDDVYYLVMHSANQEQIEQTIRDSDFIYFLGVASRSERAEELANATEITNYEIESLVECGSFAILGVFDGEAFVILDMKQREIERGIVM